MIKSPLKWVGGKGKLLPILHANLPSDWTHYYEPFCGGAALFFSLAHQPNKSFTISDLNPDLIRFYAVLKGQSVELQLRIQELMSSITESSYYEVRHNFNYKIDDSIQLAAEFFYLNRVGFQGLCRYNKLGKFNVPYGHYKKLPKQFNLAEHNKALKDVTIECSPFQETVQKITEPKDSFVYFDPPYVPISKTSNFTSYTANGFDDSLQQELLTTCKQLTSRGVKWILSNSNVPEIHEAYKEFNIQVITAPRKIGRGDQAKTASEVLIKNY